MSQKSAESVNQTMTSTTSAPSANTEAPYSTSNCQANNASISNILQLLKDSIVFCPIWNQYVWHPELNSHKRYCEFPHGRDYICQLCKHAFMHREAYKQHFFRRHAISRVHQHPSSFVQVQSISSSSHCLSETHTVELTPQTNSVSYENSEQTTFSHLR